MDWSRAKTVLIMSFLLLNILLGYQLWTSSQDFEASKAGAGFGEVQQLMNSRGVKLEAAVPEMTPSLREISVRIQDLSGLPRREPLPQPVRDDVKLVAGANVPDRVTRQLPDMGMYTLDLSLRSKGHYVYNQLYRNYPMFEVRLELYAENGMLVSYRRDAAEVLTASAQDVKEQRVLSALTAVGSVTENYLSSGAVITDIRLGYHGQLYNSETQVLAPFWRITLQSGEFYYVHAINGAVEVPQKGK